MSRTRKARQSVASGSWTALVGDGDRTGEHPECQADEEDQDQYGPTHGQIRRGCGPKPRFQVRGGNVLRNDRQSSTARVQVWPKCVRLCRIDETSEQAQRDQDPKEHSRGQLSRAFASTATTLIRSSTAVSGVAYLPSGVSPPCQSCEICGRTDDRPCQDKDKHPEASLNALRASPKCVEKENHRENGQRGKDEEAVLTPKEQVQQLGERSGGFHSESASKLGKPSCRMEYLPHDVVEP